MHYYLNISNFPTNLYIIYITCFFAIDSTIFWKRIQAEHSYKRKSKPKGWLCQYTDEEDGVQP